ncbi:DUF6273 domain-containing protein [Bianquea renquensis]|uniref:BIG2 domain-containing protein n=1 Tax=Bianquea renquensis TaxID=2763661 RepID=A0A926I1T4_9FIRM|nr:DUF6273 domain-containing protein [Bianquea renquensis]MBC8544594.1 hypothetical protein [Bianquea renquensis]
MSKVKNRKVVSAVMAVVVATAILLTGTFAWQSISQMALNEVAEEYVNPGGRLHDDFDGVNKDVYVENFMGEGEAGGVPIYARVRLDEYLETGLGAGIKDGMDGENLATPLVAGTDINDVTTWTTHLPEEGDPAGTNSAFREYYTWEMGGKTVYMPTFLKNRDSLKADINGTYAGPDGDPATDEDRYGDYETYTVGQTKTADAEYDADDNDIDEGDAGVEDVNYTLQSETHTAAETLEAQVLTMAQWKAMGAPAGPYWVYDTDGWAYWAQAIQPGEATGLLLNGIHLEKTMTTDCYYGIHVVAQFTDGRDGDWGKGAGNGFYTPDAGPEPSIDALQLLHQAAGELLKVTVSSENNAITVKTASNLQFNAAVTIADTAITNQGVTWTLEGNTSSGTSLNDAGLLTVAANEPVGTVLTVKATSQENDTAMGEMQVTVVAAADGVVISSADGATSVKRGRTLQFSAAVSNQGSQDGVSQDVTWTVSGNTASDTSISDEGLLTVGLEETVGNVLTIKATSMVNNAAVGDATVTILVLGDGVTVASAGNATTVKTARTLQFTAAVLDEGSSDGVPQGVTWAVSGNTSSSTAISTSGLLTVGEDETAGGTLTIKATSVVNSAAVGTKTVTVNPLADTVTVSTTATMPLAAGETRQYSAQVTGEGSTTGVPQNVTWTVSGNTSSSTAISSGGLLTVGADEDLNNTLTVTATSTAGSSVFGTKTVVVNFEKSVANVTAGSTTTVTIDGIKWYVLVKDGNKALLLPKDILEVNRPINSSSIDPNSPKWKGSAMETYLNDEWLSSKPVLSQKAMSTTIYTRSTWDADEDTFDTTTDKVFLLSEADVFGTMDDKTAVAKDYTYNGTMLPAPGGSWKATYNDTRAWWFLRSPKWSSSNPIVGMAIVNHNGNSSMYGSYYCSDYDGIRGGGVRPALWVTTGTYTS